MFNFCRQTSIHPIKSLFLVDIFRWFYNNCSNYAISIQLASLCLLLLFASKQTIVVIVGTRGYQCRPIGLAQTRTFSTARKSFGLSAAIMLWLTGSPWVPNDPNKYILYPWMFHLPSFAAIHSVPTFVPLHVPVLIGDVYEQLPTIKVVKLAPFAWECFFNCVCASIQAWESFCYE